MGSYAECWLDSLYLGATKNDFDSVLMALFRPRDKHVVRGAAKEMPFQVRHWLEHVENDEQISAVYYSASAHTVRDRLDLKGYTFETSQEAFIKCMRSEAADAARYATPSGDVLMDEYYKSRVALLSGLDTCQWLAALREIKEHQLGKPQSRNGPLDRSLVDYMLKRDWYGYPGADLCVPLRLALEICAENADFVYDLTDLVLNEYFNAEDDFVTMALNDVADTHSSSARTIILTEGRTDTWIISESMKLLYPHLSDYFSFVDFDAVRAVGGAGSLVNIVKSFAGAGLVNKAVALFDNDAAGEIAIRTLRQIQLPSNIHVMQLPRLDMLNHYPTVGPSGMSVMDIHGMAASIELYLGSDVLSEGGKLIPVQWTGYEPSLGKYQGEVLAKDKIHERFRKKLRDLEKNPNPIDPENWAGILSILACIFSSFHDYDGHRILGSIDSECNLYDPK